MGLFSQRLIVNMQARLDISASLIRAMRKESPGGSFGGALSTLLPCSKDACSLIPACPSPSNMLLVPELRQWIAFLWSQIYTPARIFVMVVKKHA